MAEKRNIIYNNRKRNCKKKRYKEFIEFFLSLQLIYIAIYIYIHVVTVILYRLNYYISHINYGMNHKIFLIIMKIKPDLHIVHEFGITAAKKRRTVSFFSSNYNKCRFNLIVIVKL